MFLELLLAFFIFRYLRRSPQAAHLLPKWNKYFQVGMIVSIGLMAVSFSAPARLISGWLADLILLALLYVAWTQKEFQPLKSMTYAVMPIILLASVSDAVKLISKSFYGDYDNYFQTAQLFAVIWLIALWMMTKKQRKALEVERQKALEKEKQYAISESMKAALEVQVAERTAALTAQKEELQQTVNELKSTQAQLIQSEKMASLGELTAGIAHEIQNPLNFVNNFSEVNTELIAEMKEALDNGDLEEAKAIAADITANEQKINHHGKRADAIVKGMLQHSRSSGGQKEPTDINALADEYLRLAYHGLRAKDKMFNATMKTEFDESIKAVNVIPQDMGRVILNLITNAFYAVSDRKKKLAAGGGMAVNDYTPTVTVSTKKLGNRILVQVKDNGNGIPAQVLDKIFQPFFTTKPTGEGTGLGLSMSYDIVTKSHGGELKVETKENKGMPGEEPGTTFTIQIPVQ
jgi:signal transduction histidine kinase